MRVYITVNLFWSPSDWSKIVTQPLPQTNYMRSSSQLNYPGSSGILQASLPVILLFVRCGYLVVIVRKPFETRANRVITLTTLQAKK